MKSLYQIPPVNLRVPNDGRMYRIESSPSVFPRQWQGDSVSVGTRQTDTLLKNLVQKNAAKAFRAMPIKPVLNVAKLAPSVRLNFIW